MAAASTRTPKQKKSEAPYERRDYLQRAARLMMDDVPAFSEHLRRHFTQVFKGVTVKDSHDSTCCQNCGHFALPSCFRFEVVNISHGARRRQARKSRKPPSKASLVSICQACGVKSFRLFPTNEAAHDWLWKESNRTSRLGARMRAAEPKAVQIAATAPSPQPAFVAAGNVQIAPNSIMAENQPDATAATQALMMTQAGQKHRLMQC